MSELAFLDLVAPVRDIHTGADALAFWRWLVGPDVQPLLITALGDVFVEGADGTITFLDTYEGYARVVAERRGAWKLALRDPERIEQWFTPGLVSALRDRGLILEDHGAGQLRCHRVAGASRDDGPGVRDM